MSWPYYDYTREKIEAMKGKKVFKMEVTSGENHLVFHCEDGSVVRFEATADCCSDSWIEHFDEITEPATVLDFVEIEIDGYEGEPTKKDHYEDIVSYYFYELKTDKGNYKIEMRNSSNGYYGGTLE